MAPERRWPASPAIYQIYPRSFQDTTGTGIGDLRGVAQRLDHVASLGVDAIWVSPHYLSPWVDGGYDVTDHMKVEPRLGTLADFDALVARAHALGLRVTIDQVLNHTSDTHAWFRAARAGDDAMAERYLFRDPKPDGTPPNNWLSQFGIPGWSWVHTRRQYYFHQFLACQPSLNLRHPDVQAAHAAQIAFWRGRGVEGFRFDAVTSYLWDESLADNPPASREVQARVAGDTFMTYTYQDHQHDMLPGDGAAYAERLRGWAGADAWLIGEVTSGNQSYELAMEFAAKGRLDAAYTTDLPEGRGAPGAVAGMLSRADPARIVGWLSSHDQPRHGTGSLHDACLRAAVMAFLPGPWLIYQGEEFGLAQPELSEAEVTDPLDLLYWPDGPGREGSRVPMPWDAGAPGYGFTTGTPWLPMRWDRDALRAAQAPGGVADTYRDLLRLRRAHGWDRGRVVSVEHTGIRLEMVIETPQGRYRGNFVFGDGDAPPRGGLFDLADDGTGTGAVAIGGDP